MTFIILIISACGIVMLTINKNSNDSKLSIVTSVPIKSSSSYASESSDTKKTTKSHKTTTHTKKSNKVSNNKTSTAAQSKKTTAISIKFPLDINKATKYQLMEIDGIGEVMAEKIIAHKKTIKYYSNLLQLKDIKGIGDATYKKLKKYLYVSKDKYKDFPKEQTSYSRKNTGDKTKSPKYSVKSDKKTEKKMKMVNINTADKEELKECLLISEQEALNIIKLREQVGGQYTNILELLMTMEDSEYNRIKDYVTI